MLQAEIQGVLQAELGLFPAFYSDGERLGQQKARVISSHHPLISEQS
jgi:hypothetical protein